MEFKEVWCHASISLQKRISKQPQVHHYLIKLIILAFTDWKTTEHPVSPTFLQHKFHTLFHQQSSIGWNHIIYGHFSKEWLQAVNPNTRISKKWITHVRREIWSHIYEVWKSRCDQNHGPDTSSKHIKAMLQLQPQVVEIYNSQSTAEPSEQYIFQNPIQKTLQMPIAAIETWLFKARL
jgi:hypothetical protein